MTLTMKQAIAEVLRTNGPLSLMTIVNLTKEQGEPEWLRDQIQITVKNLCSYGVIENSERTHGLYWFRSEAFPAEVVFAGASSHAVPVQQFA